ncbi:MAG TPA: hypothetical protein VFX73_05745 [Chitinophagaceae bacterium]|nr:hypothetical protein [Chitinophagaceae bacterium]
MESIKLDKGEVVLMEDRLVIENDGAINRKWRNIIFYSLIFLVILFYLVSAYQTYVNDPHQFRWFNFIAQMFIVFVLIIPSAFRRVFRYSTVKEIPYSHIKTTEPAGSIFKWDRAISLYLLDNKIRILNFKGDDMRKFKLLLEQKLEQKRPH